MRSERGHKEEGKVSTRIILLKKMNFENTIQAFTPFYNLVHTKPAEN